MAGGAALKTLGVCVDDVGLVDGGAATVVGLGAARRLSAASCLTGSPHWRREAAVLRHADAELHGVELGLHLDLSEGEPLSRDLARHWPTLPRLSALIAMAHLGRLPLQALAVELRAQVEAFEDAIGRPPAFVDGHQHVHHLPGIRERVLERVASGCAGGTFPAVRNTGRLPGPGHLVKRLLIAHTGGTALQALLERHAVRHNAVLLGVYDFSPVDYRRRMKGWLRAAPMEGGLLFCHPRAGAGRADDPIASARRHEAAYLAGNAFADDLAEAGVNVGSTWTRSSSAD